MTAVPPSQRPGWRSICIRASAVVVLPEPDSPTRPSRSPCATSKLARIHRAHDAGIGAVGHVEIADLEAHGQALRATQAGVGEFVKACGEQEQADEQDDEDAIGAMIHHHRPSRKADSFISQ